MIKQIEILNYVDEHFKRFETEFLSIIKGWSHEKKNIENYKKLVDNTVNSLLTKHQPETKNFIDNHGNNFYDFGAEASFVTMRSDFFIKCHNLIITTIKFK